MIKIRQANLDEFTMLPSYLPLIGVNSFTVLITEKYCTSAPKLIEQKQRSGTLRSWNPIYKEGES